MYENINCTLICEAVIKLTFSHVLVIALQVATLVLWANPRALQFAYLYSLIQAAVKNDLLEINEFRKRIFSVCKKIDYIDMNILNSRVKNSPNLIYNI